MNLLTRRILPATRATAPRNLLAHSEDISEWAGSADVSAPLGLGALGRFTGYALSSKGEAWHRNKLHEFEAVQGEVLCTTLWLRPGSSGNLLFRVRGLDDPGSYTLSGSFAALPVTAPAHEVRAHEVLSDGLTRRLVVRSVLPFAGTTRLEIGPFSDVAGEDLIVLAAQVESGAYPTAYQYRADSA